MLNPGVDKELAKESDVPAWPLRVQLIKRRKSDIAKGLMQENSAQEKGNA